MDTNLLEIPSQLPALPSGFTPKMTMPAAQPFDPFTPRKELVDSVIHRESGGNPKARGKAGELGLMQIMPATAAQYGITPEQLLDPTINRQIGTRYLGDLLKRYKGNEFLALMAYNSGPGNVDKGRFVPRSHGYAMDVLANSERPMQQLGGQPGAGQQQSAWSLPQFAGQPGAGQQQPSPSMLSRIGGALSDGLEGTAEAQELPPLPSGYKPGLSVIAHAASLSTPNMPSAAGSLPMPRLELPPTSGSIMPQAGGSPSMFGQQMKPSLMLDSSGKLRFGLTPATIPQQTQIQQISGDLALRQVNQAINWYDQKLAPKESQFEGSLLTPGGRHAFVQPFEAQNSRYAQALGLGRGDPDIKTFYDMIGPAIANQMRALIGGRLGYYMVNQSQLTPHLPNIDHDNLPRMREKLDDLQHHTIPLVVNTINEYRRKGMTDDQIIQAMGGDPSEVPVNPDAPDQLPSGFQIIQ